MPLSITDSPDILSLDSKIVASLCDEQFHIDLSPSTFVTGREAFAEGASVKIVNPVGVTIKDYLTSGYDIDAPFIYGFDYPIPLVAGNFQYGTYKIYVRLTDSEGTEYETEAKSVKLCAPDKKNKTKKYGCLDVKIDGNCADGKVVFMLDAPPNYQGNLFSDQVIDIEVSYPTESELPPLSSIHSAFSVRMYEGEYKVTGTVCAMYNDDNNVYFEILYKVKCSKIMRCILDECCVYEQLEGLNRKLKTDCSQEERDETASKILDTLRLLKTIKLAAKCGKDPSEYIAELEALLGCSCSCNCNDGTPIINNSPVTDFTFEGCGFTEDTVGLTKVITFTTKETILEDDGGGFITVSAPTYPDGECYQVQVIGFNASAIGQGLLFVSVSDTDSIDLSGDGKTGTPLAAALKVDTITGGNILTVGVNGAYVPAPVIPVYTSNNAIQKTGTNFQLGGNLVKNTTIDDVAFWLAIMNNVGIGIVPSITSDAPKLKVSKITFPNNDSTAFATSSILEFSHDGTAGSNTLYSGLAGTLGVGASADRTLLPNTHYSGLTGITSVGTDAALSGGMLSAVTAVGIFASITARAFALNGRLSGWSGFRVRAPLQDATNSLNEFGGIDDVYGLYVEQLRSGAMAARITRSWGLYQVNNLDNNFLASTLKVGGTDTIAPSAQLEVTSTVKGSIPFPVMTQVQRLAIASPAIGLHVYQSDVTEGVYVNKSTGWAFAY